MSEQEHAKRALQIALDAYEDAKTAVTNANVTVTHANVALADAIAAVTNAKKRFETYLSKNPDVLSDLSQYKNAEEQLLGRAEQNLKDAQQALEKRENVLNDAHQTLEKRENVLKQFREEENALHIQAMPQSREPIRPFLTHLIPFSVPEEEFLITKYSENTLIPTPSLNKVFAEAGGFPSNYFIRQEELILWDLVQEKHKARQGRQSVAIVGSPGVGKSTFLMVLAVYYLLFMKRNVLIVRKLKDRYETDGACVLIYLSTDGLYTKGNIKVTDLFDIRGFYKDRKPLIFLDGFNDDEVNNGPLFSDLRPFDFLATSCQYDAKSNDPVIIIVLPAWRLDSLKKYVTFNPNWAIDTKLRNQVRNAEKNLLPLAEQQYFYSGGSLREFFKERDQLQADCIRSTNSLASKQAFEMVHNYCGPTTRKQVDRIRRHYVQDYKNKNHYLASTYWKTSVDSAFIMQTLRKFTLRDHMLELYTYAETIGAGFLGTAFENLFHYTVRDIINEKNVAVLKMPQNSKYLKVCIDVGNVLCDGTSKQECQHVLRNEFNDSTYWYPNYQFMPFVDSIAPCIVHPRKGKPILRLAYIQVTIASEKTFLPDRMKELDDLIRQNETLRKYESVYVVVTPNENACDKFQFKAYVPSKDASINYDTTHEEADLDDVDADDFAVDSVNEMNSSKNRVSAESEKWLRLVAYFDPKCKDEFTESRDQVTASKSGKRKRR